MGDGKLQAGGLSACAGSLVFVAVDVVHPLGRPVPGGATLQELLGASR